MEGIVDTVLVDRNIEAATDYTTTIRCDLSLAEAYGKPAKNEEKYKKTNEKREKREKSRKIQNRIAITFCDWQLHV